MKYQEWINNYENIIREVLKVDHLDIDRNELKTFYDKGMDPKWISIINLQEEVESFTFSEWKRMVDLGIELLIEKRSDDIDDLPYYDLWDNNFNPLQIIFHSVFRSSEPLPNQNSNRKLWLNSKVSWQIENCIRETKFRPK